MSAEVSLAAALLAGIVSFLSPCVLPLVPGYLSYVSGITVSEFTAGGAGVAAARGFVLRTTALTAGAFVLGFTTVFVLLGASATTLGRFLLAQGALFNKLAGIVIILFGLHILGILKIPLLYREKRLHTDFRPRSLLGSYGIGMAFAFGWTPCIGPILAGVLSLAANQATVFQGMGLLVVYSLGLGVPFLLAALGVNYLTAFITRFRRFYRAVEWVSGLLLISVGILIFADGMTWLSNQLDFLNRFAL